MAGTIPLSMTQQFDIYSQPLAGGQLYIIQAGTVSTPQDAFQDTALTIKQPYPMTLDAAGRVPQFFLADGTVKVRLQDKHGVVQLAADNVLVIGPSGGGPGPGSSVDPTQLIQTGNMIFRYGTVAVAGYVRLNNLTIGSATSGATERANADCQALFLQLWGVDPTLSVSGGRGANALADWTANKQLTLPDGRGRLMAGLDTMGNVPAGRLTIANCGFDGATLGAAGGIASQSIAQNQLPSIALSFNGGLAVVSVSSGTANLVSGNIAGPFNASAGGSSVAAGTSFATNASVTSTGNFTPAGTISPANINGGVAQQIFVTTQPTMVVTIYLKL